VPELPEVETVVRQLAPLLVDRRIRRFEIRDRLLLGSVPLSLDGTGISAVFREGKQIVFEIAADGSPGRRAAAGNPVSKNQSVLGWLAIHLRMTGRLLWSFPNDSAQSRGKTRAEFAFEHGRLCFVDTRRFGTFAWHEERSSLRSAGVDPLRASFRIRNLRELIGSSTQEIKPWLMRQDKICGIGNIYASEILAEAGLSPFLRAGSLDRKQLTRLHKSIRKVLRDAIKHCGTTFSDFQDARGVKGKYQDYLRVYDRENMPCRACGHGITRSLQGGRSTYFCEQCTTLPPGNP